VRTVERAGLDWPLVIAGDGPERHAIAAAAARSDRDVRLVGWIDQAAAAAWMGHASMLIFPSRGPESLSRVLIEASALGVPIAAMNTGGTPDIVTSEQTGLLSATADGLAHDVRRLREDEALRRRLGAAARVRAESHFDAPAVVARIERLYMELAGRTR
jgi:glycosyltransferase involved in cell wall biosynthesis